MARNAQARIEIKIQHVQSKFIAPVATPGGDQCANSKVNVAIPISSGISCIQTDFLEGEPAMCDEVRVMESIYAQVEIAATL